MEQYVESIFPERTVVYAGFWERFGAVFIDGLILAIPNLIIKYGISGSFVSGWILQVVLSWLYHALMMSGAWQATLGKRALGIKVTDLDGNRISFGQATGRYFATILSVMILLIGYFMMLWNDRRQTLHDMIAGTLVVKA